MPGKILLRFLIGAGNSTGFIGSAISICAFSAALRKTAKYVPAYGGYCAFGASVGKKFIGDPEVWRVVDGTLYLNLDTGIQEAWLKDVPGRIKTANAKWKVIKNKSPSSL